MQRHPRRTLGTIGLGTVLAFATLASACSNDPVADGPTTSLGNVRLVAALQPFDKCEDALAKIKELALAEVGPYGLGNNGPVMMEDMAVPGVARSEGFTEASGTAGVDDAGGPPTTPAPSADQKSAEQTAGFDGTGTNNQEADVDEADVVKTDGTRILTLRNNELIVADLAGGGPRIVGRLALGETFSGQQLFLRGDRVFVMGSVYDAGPADGSGAKRGISWMSYGNATIVEVALTTEGPKETARTSIEGNLLDGRMSGDTLRLVLTTPGGSGLGFVYPSTGGKDAEDRAEAANREVIESSTLDDWVPNVVGPNGRDRALIDCDHLYRPAEPSGFSTLSILTITDGLGSLTGEGVLADGQITYASTGHVYIATNRWQGIMPMTTDGGDDTTSSDEAVGTHTDIHRFATPAGEPAAYEASGRIDGSVLNQYSMSESNGVLRVATTTDAVGDKVSQSGIVTLRASGGALVEVGRIDGLGATETIRSVRYVGDTAYVVTFRQTDPLYVIDLSDPAAPKKLGELKVPGFSSYLHPVGDRLVLGVGSDANEEGRITGAKLSLFDTGDPLAPKELATWTNRSLGFMADGDPKAFSWDAERSTAYLPYYGSCFDSFNCADVRNGVLVVKVADGTITEVGRIDHSDRTPTPALAPTTTTTTSTPETTVPETTVPETTIPGTTTPDTTAPETTVPATTVPVRATETTLAPAEPGASSSSSPAAPPVCDPAACDPAPYPDVVVQPTITRAFVIGNLVITLSDVGLAAHTVDGLRPAGFAAF